MAICLAPALEGAPVSEPVSLFLAVGRSFLSKAIRPVDSRPMTSLPMRVSCVTCGADMMQTMASQ